MSNHAKDLRKQLRNVVQELLPQLVTAEVYQAALSQVREEIKGSLSSIDKHIKENLAEMNQRSQDIQAYIMNRVAAEEKNRLSPFTPPTDGVLQAAQEEPASGPYPDETI